MFDVIKKFDRLAKVLRGSRIIPICKEVFFEDDEDNQTRTM